MQPRHPVRKTRFQIAASHQIDTHNSDLQKGRDGDGSPKLVPNSCRWPHMDPQYQPDEKHDLAKAARQAHGDHPGLIGELWCAIYPLLMKPCNRQVLDVSNILAKTSHRSKTLNVSQ